MTQLCIDALLWQLYTAHILWDRIDSTSNAAPLHHSCQTLDAACRPIIYFSSCSTSAVVLFLVSSCNCSTKYVTKSFTLHRLLANKAAASITSCLDLWSSETWRLQNRCQLHVRSKITSSQHFELTSPSIVLVFQRTHISLCCPESTLQHSMA